MTYLQTKCHMPRFSDLCVIATNRELNIDLVQSLRFCFTEYSEHFSKYPTAENWDLKLSAASISLASEIRTTSMLILLLAGN
jgi:hypothetical protein